MNGEVTTDKEGHFLQVRLDGKVVMEYDEISNDYAYTLRSDYARNLKRALPQSTTKKEATDKAWQWTHL